MAILSSGIVNYENLVSVAAASVPATYASGGNPVTSFTQPIRLLTIKNNTNQNILISFDGVNTKKVAIATSGEKEDFGSNKANQCGFLELPENTKVYIEPEGTAPNTGKFYIEAIYATNSSGG